MQHAPSTPLRRLDCVGMQVLQPGDVAVDATCGNGHDSLFMAQCIGPTGQLHAVDLQVSHSSWQLSAVTLPFNTIQLGHILL